MVVGIKVRSIRIIQMTGMLNYSGKTNYRDSIRREGRLFGIWPEQAIFFPARRRCLAKQPEFETTRNGFGPIGGFQLVDSRFHMVLHSVLADAEDFSDFRIG